MARQLGKESPDGKTPVSSRSKKPAEPTRARKSGKSASRPRPDPGPAEEELEGPPGSAGNLPEFVRRALAAGFSGFFTTEETIRKALGDTLPKDWIDFAVDQSDRARQEFMDRVSVEIGRSLSEVDLATLIAQVLEGRTLEVKASIKLGSRDDGPEFGVEFASKPRKGK